MSALILPTASVEILPSKNDFTCDICHSLYHERSSQARYNVFDGNTPLYACGTHLALAVRRVATVKGT
jgi:hypothetical protein